MDLLAIFLVDEWRLCRFVPLKEVFEGLLDSLSSRRENSNWRSVPPEAKCLSGLGFVWVNSPKRVHYSPELVRSQWPAFIDLLIYVEYRCNLVRIYALWIWGNRVSRSIGSLFPGTSKSPNSSFCLRQRLNLYNRRGINLLQNQLCNSITLRDYMLVPSL